MMAKEASQEIIQTREAMKKEKQKEKLEKKVNPRRIRLRLIPIWLRLFLVVLLIAASLAGGLMVGYGVIGDGNPTDVFNKSTWTHIIDLVVKNP